MPEKAAKAIKNTGIYTYTQLIKQIQESRAVARKTRNAAAVHYLVTDVHFPFW